MCFICVFYILYVLCILHVQYMCNASNTCNRPTYAVQHVASECDTWVLHSQDMHLCAASMGVTEGKSIGEWFGPNTVMQVFRLVWMTCFHPVMCHLPCD